MEPTDEDWRRVGQEIKARMNELVIGPSDVKARGGPTDKPLKGYIAGRRIERREVKRRLCSALRWAPNSIDRILAGQSPVEETTTLLADDPALEVVRRIRDLADEALRIAGRSESQ